MISGCPAVFLRNRWTTPVVLVHRPTQTALAAATRQAQLHLNVMRLGPAPAMVLCAYSALGDAMLVWEGW